MTGTAAPPTYRLSDEQRELRDAVRVLARERVAPRAAEIDRTAEFPWDLKELLATQDILGLPYPAEYGGLGADLLTTCLAIEELSAACATTGLILAVHELAALPIVMAGTAEQKARWLPDLAAGRKLVAFALTEAGAGSDAGAIATRAVRDGDDYVIDGSKRFISQGERRRPRHGLRGHRPGREAPPQPVLLRRRARDARLQRRPARAQDGHPRLADRRAPVRRRSVSRPPTGSARRGRGSPWRCGRSSGPGRGSPPRPSGSPRARSTSRPATPRERVQFGKPIGEHQMIQALLADMDAQTEAARALLYTACAAIEAGDGDAGRWAAVCKLVAGDTAMRVTTDAVQVLGGYGYLDEFPVERMMRDAKITQLYEGTQQIQRLVIARSLLAARR